MKERARLAWLGALETMPLVIAAFPFGIVFGAMAHTIGLSFAATLGMSAIVYAGSSQFIAISLIAAGTALPVIVMTVFIVNLRQMLYSANLMHQAESWPQPVRAVLAFWLTDETFAAVSDHLNRHPGEPGLRWKRLKFSTFSVAALAACGCAGAAETPGGKILPPFSDRAKSRFQAMTRKTV